MTVRRTVWGLSILCALLVNGVAVQGASAAGTTAYTCVATFSGAQFTENHCKTSAGGGAGFHHVAIANNTTTEVTAGSGTVQLKATVGGILVELEASPISAFGWMENREEGGEMYADGQGSATFLGATVASPVAKGCEVFSDVIGKPGTAGIVFSAPGLTGTTKGQGDAVKLQPTFGEALATFWIQNCKGSAALEALNKQYTVTGSLKGMSNGATLNFGHTETTSQNTLKLNGAIKAGFAGSLTIEGRANSGQFYTGLSPTT